VSLYHLVLVPDGEPPRLLSFDDRDGLAAWFKAARPVGGYAYVVRGERLLLTAGAYRYLDDGGELVPLFDAPSPGVPSQEASLEELSRLDAAYAELTPAFGPPPPIGKTEN
jgi:hypothetical protein